jgi:hypothetical protein
MRSVPDGLSTSAIGGPGLMNNFQKSNEQIERLCGHLDPDAVRHGGLRATARFRVAKCVDEDNVIDPLERWLKQKRSRFHKRAIFFMNREKARGLATASRHPDFSRSRSLALEAAVHAIHCDDRDADEGLTDSSADVSEQKPKRNRKQKSKTKLPAKIKLPR